MREILFVAGEPSGDLHAAGVARALAAERPDVPLTGIGGDGMRANGVALLAHCRSLAVMGFAEVLAHIPRHWRLLRQLRARLRSGDVALVILVDYPGFNMKVAAAARRANVPVLYYITPQVWAWGRHRLAQLARWVTRAAVILPFEERLLRDSGVPATFVGHPLLDRARDLPTREAARHVLALPPDAPVLALFPGSRVQELARHLAGFVAAARVLERRVPGLRVVVSAAPHVRIDAARCPYPVVHESSLSVLAAADAALCKSGTTTLEAAVALCPLVVAYRTSPLTYFLARRLVTIPHIGLVNVVAGREVAREFVQDDFDPDEVARTLHPLLDHGSGARATMVEALRTVRDALGESGAAERVARLALEMIAAETAPA